MVLTKSGYRTRLIDAEIDELLRLFGAVCIEGPKWCGKTWTALNHSNSFISIADSSNGYQNRQMAKTDPLLIMDGDAPRLIDEWQDVPPIWDAVRNSVDDKGEKGAYILTGSATPNMNGISHSGTGRICRTRMHTMSLFESGRSSGKISLHDLFSQPNFTIRTGDIDLRKLIDLTLHGGWPGTMDLSTQDSLKISDRYVDTMVKSDISFDGIERKADTMQKVLRSLARNESTVVSISSIRKDIEESEDDAISYGTVDNYIEALNRLFVTEWQPAFDPNMRSSVRVGKSPKKHLVDPSISAAVLKATPEKMINDLNTFGFFFEALCEHDLRIYSQTFGGELYHYRDGDGREIDAVVELPDGRWGAFEIKLGVHQIDDAAESLLKMKSKIENQPKGRPPTIMCVICGMISFAYRREDGVYVIPITALKN